MKIKRTIAYLIDVFIVSFISTLIFQLPVFKADYNRFLEISEEVNSFLIAESTSGSSDVDDEKIIDLQYESNKASVPLFTIRVGLLILYFGVFGYCMKGQTLGKMIFKIRIVPNEGKKLHPGLFMLREGLFTNIIPEVATLVCLILCSKDTCLEISSYISYISLMVTFLCVGFIVFRDDERGLHEIIGKTKMIDLNGQVKDK